MATPFRRRPPKPKRSPTAEPDPRALDDLASLKQRYDETQNPVWAAYAYTIARGANLPVPAWVHDYLWQAFANLRWLLQGDGVLNVVTNGRKTSYPITQPKAGAIAPAIAAAFGFVPGGVDATEHANHHPEDRRASVGRWNPLEVRDRDLEIALSVHLHHKLDESKLLQAYEYAAAEHRVTRRTAERAWKKHHRAFLK